MRGKRQATPCSVNGTKKTGSHVRNEGQNSAKENAGQKNKKKFSSAQGKICIVVVGIRDHRYDVDDPASVLATIACVNLLRAFEDQTRTDRKGHKLFLQGSSTSGRFVARARPR
jgi:hypothetical protein